MSQLEFNGGDEKDREVRRGVGAVVVVVVGAPLYL